MKPYFSMSYPTGVLSLFHLRIQHRFTCLLVLSGCLTLCPGALLMGQSVNSSPDYLGYHSLINQAEVHLSDRHFQQALNTYDEIFDSYSFVFERDYKIAIQLAAYQEKDEKVLKFLQKGFRNGLDLKEVKKLPFLKKIRNSPGWDRIENAYDSLRAASLNPVDIPTRETVWGMYKKDQKKAMGALLRIGDKAQIAYAEKNFAPHSEEQLSQLTDVINMGGYPGEKRIRNDYWASTILSHHNSISSAYNQSDTLYTNLKPLLLEALKAGDISPYELAMIEDWRIATVSGWSEPGYGYLNPPRTLTLAKTDSLRAVIGLRSVSLRNRLVAVEVETGMDFFLPDWVQGKIQIKTEEE